ncbi:MAG: SEC-C motif-containing protein [Phenylobacterium sp.]|jgi:SEC-C motif-containing protein
MTMLCPCCSGQPYVACCEPLISAKQTAPTPEALMRSRYSAYTQHAIDYIVQTYAHDTRAQSSAEDIAQWAKSVTFVRLDVIATSKLESESGLKPQDNTGAQAFVEFSAHYLQDNKHHQLHEKSRFVVEQQQWRYIDGTLIPEPVADIGRNDSCPCMSGKKFKKCHG